MSSDPVLIVRRVANARGMRLAIDPRDRSVRLILPPRISEARGRAWAGAQRVWIEAALARIPAAHAIEPGARFPFRGQPLTIDWAEGHPRTPAVAGDRLVVGGPRERLARRVTAWAAGRALAVLDAETRVVAARAGVTVGRVSVGDARGRWGSCSGRGDIRYSWRLVMAPPFVLTAIVAHEVAHRLHMDHSPAFHAANRHLLGDDPAPARAWLRAHGAELYRIGRASSTSSTGTPSRTG